jgi:hypothetical protein
VCSAAQNVIGFVVLTAQRIEVPPHLYSHLPAGTLCGVAGCTDSSVPKSQHLIVRLCHGMIAVTRGAARDAHLDEDWGVDALVEEVRLHRVTLATDIAYPRAPPWRGAVIAMAVVAGRGREIALD